MSDAKELRVAILHEYSKATSPRAQQACAILYDLVSDDVFAPAINDWLLTHLPDVLSIRSTPEELTPNAVEDAVITAARYLR